MIPCVNFQIVVLDRNIFPNFIVSADLTHHINNDDIRSDFLKVKEDDEGMKRTNVMGWHSSVMNTETLDFPHLNQAVNLTKEFVNEFLEEEGTILHVDYLEYWLMENGSGGLQLPPQPRKSGLDRSVLH